MEYVDTQFRLGYCYKFRVGVEKDDTKAFEYCKKSAEKEHSMAQGLLGVLYENGKGTKKDLEKAIYKAAENGEEMARAQVVRLGIGIEKDGSKFTEKGSSDSTKRPCIIV